MSVLSLYYSTKIDWIVKLTILNINDIFEPIKNIDNIQHLVSDSCNQFILFCRRTDTERTAIFSINHETRQFVIPTDKYEDHLHIINGGLINGNLIWDEIPNLREFRKRVLPDERNMEVPMHIETSIKDFFMKQYTEALTKIEKDKPILFVRGLHEVFQEYFILNEEEKQLPLYKTIYDISTEIYSMFFNSKCYSYFLDKYYVLCHHDLSIKTNRDNIFEQYVKMGKEVTDVVALHPMPIHMKSISKILKYHDDYIWFEKPSRQHSPYCSTEVEKILLIDKYMQTQMDEYDSLKQYKILYKTSIFGFHYSSPLSDEYQCTEIGEGNMSFSHLKLLKRCIFYKLKNYTVKFS